MKNETTATAQNQNESPIQPGARFEHRTGVKMTILSIQDGVANIRANEGWGCLAQTVASLELSLAEGRLTEIV